MIGLYTNKSIIISKVGADSMYIFNRRDIHFDRGGISSVRYLLTFARPESNIFIAGMNATRFLLLNPLSIGLSYVFLAMFFIEAYTHAIFIPFLIISAMVIQAIIVPLPSSAVAVGSGAVYGIFLGSIYVGIGALIGASLCFFISKKYGKSYIKGKFRSSKSDKINNFMIKYGFFAILAARLIPLISFDLISYAAGLTKISFKRFFLATFIGIIPGTIFYTWLGISIVGYEVFGLVSTLVIVSTMIFYLKN